MEAPALLSPLNRAAAALWDCAAAASRAAGLLAAGEPLPGGIRLLTEREGGDFALSCAFPLAKRAEISPQAAAERLCTAPGWGIAQEIRAENGYLNATLPEEMLLQELEFLCALPEPEPGAAYVPTAAERHRRDRGCPLYAVTYMQARLGVLAERENGKDAASGELSEAERRLVRSLCRTADLLAAREGAALLHLLAAQAAVLRDALDGGTLQHRRILFLRGAERVLSIGIKRMGLAVK